jgi:DNA invertase Pin-like site-specific DNA recombinase
MTSRVALYARYSTDMQRDASIEDQLRVCRAFAANHSWPIIDSYSDRAISGASMLRQGVQDLLADASARRFDIVLAEALDRLSRDQADIATLYKHLTFAGVRIMTIAEGEITEMHIGLKGTMNALFLKDLGLKTHRGLRGRVEAGKSGGGNSYGYEVVRSFSPDGTPIAGERRIKPAEAETIRRIFREFADGKSPRTIAHALNREKVPGPRGAAWGQSTINGNAERGTGILNNELYVGRLVWNRLRYVKDPATGKRVSRPNPPEKLVTADVPDLRILDEDLWQAVKSRQVEARKFSFPARGEDIQSPDGAKNGFWSHKRPRHLLTGLMRCGVCGGAYSKLNTHLFGCATARNKGTCDNRLNIRVDKLDEIVLTGLKARMMDPDVFKSFVDAFIAERNAIISHQNAKFTAAKGELARVKSRQKILVQALADGVPARTVKDEMISVDSDAIRPGIPI